MNEIKCPHCGTVFRVDESGFADIVKQVRDAEFNREIERREKLFAEQREQAVALAGERVRGEARDEIASRDAEIAKLTQSLDTIKRENDAASRAAQAEQIAALSKITASKDAEIAELKSKLARLADERASDARVTEADHKRALADATASRDAKIAELTQKLEVQKTSFATEKELAVTQARTQVERERDDLAAQVKLKAAESEQQVSALREEMATKLRAKDELIAYKEEEIARYKEMKARLSTKMVGESLEQHCETEFNRLRMTAFPNAYFEKDNDASEGTKGDFIFRECDASGNEIISIMFEMKNENDETATKHKNEDFFKKLDHDRRQKGCEYAVLCTLLEPESELYNAGIVDVSYRYEKMYVIRPQFFIPMITLLRNAAMGSLRYKQELAEYKQQNIDVTNFEAKMEKFKDGFSRNYNLASKQFESAIKEIDAAIKQLEKTKDDLRRSTENLRLAHNKADELTIRKLTWGNKTMKAAFDEARETAADTGDEPAEADSYEVEDTE